MNLLLVMMSYIETITCFFFPFNQEIFNSDILAHETLYDKDIFICYKLERG